MKNSNALQYISSYQFKNPTLLQQALTHPSFARDKEMRTGQKVLDYERLEFLGDAVLAMVITDILINKYPDETEGELAKRRAALVCSSALAKVATDCKLGKMLILGESEKTAGGKKNPKILENAMEAVIGAVYVDGGFTSAFQFIQKLWHDLVHDMNEVPVDYKTLLQEWSQKRGKPIPDYQLIKQSGPAHLPQFEVEVIVEGCEKSRGTGASKKAAQSEAAKLLYTQLTSENDQ